MKNNKKRILGLLLAIVIIGVLIINKFFIGTEFVYSGTIESTNVDLSAQVPSTVGQIMVKQGSFIKAGDLLMQLACEDIKVAYNQSQKDFDRASKLKKEGSISQEIYEHIESKFLEQKIRYSWCSIVAPLDGTVIDTYREVGESVAPGVKLLTVANLKDLWAYIYLSANDLQKIELNQKLVGHIPQLDKNVSLKVIHINSQAEFTPKNIQTRNEMERLVYGVKVQLENIDNLKIYPGMNLEVTLHE